MKTYEIEIILIKEEISPDFQIICWKENYKGTKKDAVKRAKRLQKEWKAEMYNIIEV